MNANAIAEKNNVRRELLNSHNAVYYENLVVYIRSTFFIDERATEEVLLEMLEHLIDAQGEGKVGEDVFGKSPKELADDIIKTLPSEKKSVTALFMAEIMTLLLGVYITMAGIFNLFTSKQETFYVGSVLICLAVITGGFFIVVLGILKLLKLDAMHNKSKLPIVTAGFLFVAFVLAVAITVNEIPNYGNPFTVGPLALVAVGLALLLISWGSKKLRMRG